ncbi:MAG: hypothetical protein A2041_00640 [Bacteroidetes bacterium GWA2_31_9b]|nr:MAG: hypothetical protein A2041_00640 [Bacteroidetes bacterium GWA2_31_9b]
MIKDNYLYNTEYQNIDDFIPSSGSIYIYGYSTEGRSYSVDVLIKKFNSQVNFVQIKENGKDRIIDLSSNNEYSLRNSEDINGFFNLFKSHIIYIDVTGLNNRISASLLKHALQLSLCTSFPEIRVIYAEPDTYKIERFKSEGVFNDLSEQISGIDPLPGFASIIPDEIGESIFVVLLGFEGGRFTHIIENIQPQGDTIIPVVGIPGFRLEYPFVAYWGNRRPIQETDTWRNVKFVAANSIVDIYIFLSKLEKKYPNKKIKIAPIGTKPHAIGAIIFAIKYFNKVEIIYDNPIRKKKRTTGVGKIVECKVCKLVKEK